jgi:AcrR family transcriptional regulator
MTKRTYTSGVRDSAAQATRERILKASHDVLANRRVTFSLEAVAKRARVTRLTIYNQFGTKRGLLDAVFDDLAVRGGLDHLKDAFAISDPHAALRSFVAIFCGFWAEHRALMPRFMVALADPDVAESLRERRERKRSGLTVLVGRIMPQANKQAARELVDVLHAFTSFEFFHMLATPDRSAADIGRLIQGQVEAAVAHSMS